MEKGLDTKEMKRKGIENKGKILFICFAAMTATACGGPSGEKIAGVQGVYADLVNFHNEIVEAYAELEDDSFREELDAMAEKIDDIGQQDTQGMTNEELEAVVNELNEYKKTHDGILASIQEMESEEPEKKIYEVSVTIENNTGVIIHNLYLYKASDTDKGKNLLEDMECLDGLATLNILNLYMAEDEMLWHLEASEDSGNVIESADVDFTGKAEEGVKIIMKFSFDSMEGWIDF